MNGYRLPPRHACTAATGVRLSAVVLAACIALSACRFFDPSLTLSIAAPEAPEHWRKAFEPLEYCLVYPNTDTGELEKRWFSEAADILIDIPKTLAVPVLLYPYREQRSLRLPPAGGVYPLDCDASCTTLSLSWRHGAAARVLCRLWEGGMEGSAVNAARLMREMAARCPGDPWALDLDRICSRLASGEFRVTDIRPAPSRRLQLQPGTGCWFLESPFRHPLPAYENGSLILEAVPLGMHYLFKEESNVWYLLYVEQEQVLISRSP